MEEEANKTLRILTYNCLLPEYLDPAYYGGETKPFHEEAHRFAKILELLVHSEAEVMLLQEVSPRLLKLLKGDARMSSTYECYCSPKPNEEGKDLVAIFVAKVSWRYCYSHDNKDGKNFVFSACFQHLATLKNMRFASVHLDGYPAAVLDRTRAILELVANNLGYDAVIGGDFNATPDEPIYELLTEGKVSEGVRRVTFDDKEVTIQVPEMRLITTGSPLQHSVCGNDKEQTLAASPLDQYQSQQGLFVDLASTPKKKKKKKNNDEESGEAGTTTYGGPSTTFKTDLLGSKVVDYLFGTSGTFKSFRLVSPKPREIESIKRGLPDEDHPSDHLPLIVEAELS